MALAALLVCAAANASTCRGEWSAKGVNPYDGKAVSPDGASSILGSPGGLALFSGNSRKELPIEANPPLTEIVWSGDSRFAAVNVSDGGGVGTWSTNLVEVRSGRLITEVLRSVKARASKVARCATPEVANLGVVGWSHDGRRVFVMLEVPPHSSCANMGATVGYEVDTTDGHVAAELTAATARRNWARFLGCRVKELR